MRVILHSDCNSFYASVEAALDPSLRGKPVAVCGDPKERHGIVLAKSEEAKRYGIRTGNAVWEARQKCPGLIVLPPNGEQYRLFSQKMRAIYADYTDQVEPFGLDESWLDVTGTRMDALQVASAIRRRAKEELGITVSIGVSFNKVFAKLGSDMHKPDATTVISPDNYREKVWPLPVGELLFIGRATARKLREYGIETIGDIAQSDARTLHALLGKCGDMLHLYACGQDDAPVAADGHESELKSIGNSTTPAYDIDDAFEARRIIYLLCDSVASRLREHALRCRTVSLWIRDTALCSFERQAALRAPADLARDISQSALALLHDHWDSRRPLRSLGVRGCDLVPARQSEQLSAFSAPENARERALESTLDALRARFGQGVVQRGLYISTPARAFDINAAHNIAAANFSAIHGHLEG